MVPRTTIDRTEIFAALLPLAISLGLGSVVSVTTLSWGKRFALWQLMWWLLTYVVTVLIVAYFGDKYIGESNPLAEWVRKRHGLSLAFFLSGLGVSIYLVVSNRAASTIFLVYWPLPLSAWWFELGSVNDRQQEAASVRDDRARFHADVNKIETAIVEVLRRREQRWKAVTAQEAIKLKVEFEGQFLLALYLAAAGSIRQVPIRAVWAQWNIALSPEGPELRALLSQLKDVENRYPREPDNLLDATSYAAWNDMKQFNYRLNSIKEKYLLDPTADRFGDHAYEYEHYLDAVTEPAVMVWRERKDIKVEKVEEHRDLDDRIRSWQHVWLTAQGVGLCRLAEDVGSIHHALQERERGYRVENQFNFKDSSASGIFGSRNNVTNTTFTQGNGAIDHISLDELARELHMLRGALLAHPMSSKSQEAETSIHALSEAAEAAQNGDRQGVKRHLARTGKWTIDVATQIGSALAIEAIKAALKI